MRKNFVSVTATTLLRKLELPLALVQNFNEPSTFEAGPL